MHKRVRIFLFVVENRKENSEKEEEKKEDKP